LEQKRAPSGLGWPQTWHVTGLSISSRDDTSDGGVGGRR
jgi:hypothetical protein